MTERLTCEQAAAALVDNRHGANSTANNATLDAHLAQCPACAADAAALQDLQQLLDRPLQPSPLARARFLAALRQAETTAGRPGLLQWLQSLWPARPIGSFSYSAALLLAGVLGGQLLPPHSLGIGPELAEQGLTPDRLVQLCAVPPPPAGTVL